MLEMDVIGGVMFFSWQFIILKFLKQRCIMKPKFEIYKLKYS